MTEEVKQIIESKFVQLFNELETAVHTGITENGGLMSDIERDAELDAGWNEACDAVQVVLDNQRG